MRWCSRGRNGAGLTLPFFAANRLPQQKIFEDKFPFASRKRSTAGTAGDPPIDSSWPSFDFDDLIEPVAIRAIDKCRLIAHAQSPTNQVDDIITRGYCIFCGPFPKLRQLGYVRCDASGFGTPKHTFERRLLSLRSKYPRGAGRCLPMATGRPVAGGDRSEDSVVRYIVPKM
jgi:hypothetical protein